MKDRIKQYIDYKSISAGELATLLEVQRSNISHILNGRNKPGANFIEKLLICFPDLNARWLLTGEGDMTESHESPTINESAKVVSENQIKLAPSGSKPELNKDKPIDKVVLLFADGTFTDFKQK